VCAVCEQESAWDTYAVRFEPDFLSRYVVPLQLKSSMNGTEAHCRAISWGLMQVMGEVAREFGFKGEFLSELCDPLTGLEWGCVKLADCLKRAGGDVEAALVRWNGGGNPNYASEVLARRARYSQDGQREGLKQI
jgi:soluble lytic murein transglycosylase-like protein